MSMIQSSRMLRGALALDATACAATGLLLAFGAVPLAGAFGFPAGLLRAAGGVLLPCAAVLAWLACRETLPRLAVQGVIALNLVWIADSLVILLAGLYQPNALGIAFVLAQAAAVAAITELEVIGLKRSHHAAGIATARS